jgi:predicted transcriptional regulator
MFEDTLELAENKLLLLFIFKKIKFPVSNNQITQIILENNFINYFTLQQYLTELLSSNFLKYTDETGNHRFVITEKGIRVLSLFENRISEDKVNAVDTYLSEKINNIKKEVTVTADYTIENKGNFIVNLKALENDSILIDIKLNVGSNKDAKDLCHKWKNDSSEIYNKIIQLLINE